VGQQICICGGLKSPTKAMYGGVERTLVWAVPLPRLATSLIFEWISLDLASRAVRVLTSSWVCLCGKSP
jgi:hypothetical protein